MKRIKSVRVMLILSALIILFVLLMQPISVFHFREYISVLFPAGKIALEERNLLLILQGLMLLVIIPVYILTFIFSWKYRATNPKHIYEPDLVDSKLAEYVWWGLPFVMTMIVCAFTWIKTHELDPYKPIESDKKPLTIQAVALQWKWLFIYPEEKIATLNYLQIPKDVPIHFEITADAPMNSLWIPELGGQIYAMPNMKTELNLIANKTGDFRGSSANLSGEGFAAMHFMTRASMPEDYEKWLADAKKSSQNLDFSAYEQLAKPSQDNPVAIYQLQDDQLFHKIMMKYMPKQEIR